MIDNIILIIKYSLNGQTISAAELEKECNPLGKIPTHIINAISAFDNSPKGYSDLFHIILVELPVGKYFCAYLNEQSHKGVLYVPFSLSSHAGRSASEIDASRRLADASAARRDAIVPRRLLPMDANAGRLHSGDDGRDSEDKGGHAGDSFDSEQLQHGV